MSTAAPAAAPKSNLVPLLILGGAGAGVAYYLYQRSQRPVVDLPSQGTGGNELAQAACQAAAIASGIPPALAASGCGVVASGPGIDKLFSASAGLVDTAGSIAKGVVIDAPKAVVKGVGKGVKAVAWTAPKAVVKGGIKGTTVVAKGVGKVGKAVLWTAPKKVVTTGAKVVKTLAWTAPKKVVTTVGKTAVKGVKKVAGWFGLGDDELAELGLTRDDLGLQGYGSRGGRRLSQRVKPVRRTRKAGARRGMGLAGIGGHSGKKACCASCASGAALVAPGVSSYERTLAGY